MNKKGQSLIIFVLLLPVIILFIAYILSYSNSLYEKNRITNIIKDNLEIIVNKDIKDIDKINNNLKDNNITSTIIINNDIIKIDSIYDNKNYFGKVFKLDSITINYCGNYSTKEIYEC